jgi:hypothetical protein
VSYVTVFVAAMICFSKVPSSANRRNAKKGIGVLVLPGRLFCSPAAQHPSGCGYLSLLGPSISKK